MPGGGEGQGTRREDEMGDLVGWEGGHGIWYQYQADKTRDGLMGYGMELNVVQVCLV